MYGIHTKRGKARFTRDLCGSILSDVLADIRAGRIPAEWNGHQLRELLADKFDAARGNLDRKQLRAYRADKYSRNIA